MLALWLQYLDKMEYELGLYSFRQFIVNRMNQVCSFPKVDITVSSEQMHIIVFVV